MTAEMATRVGRAVARTLCDPGGGQIVIGQDTRQSGDMLAHATAAGVCSAGASALMAGVLPTPAVAVLARRHAAAGIVISASHNPYRDNGIKVFDACGFKLSQHLEAQIEALALAADPDRPPADGDGETNEPGRVVVLADAVDTYDVFLQTALLQPSDAPLRGIRVVVDCANGATSAIAPRVLRALGAEVHALHAAPDGRNINAGCGSEHPEALQAAVLRHQAQLGVAFDGDGDRLLAVDETGRAVSGDHLLAIFAQHAAQREPGSKTPPVVSTVMSNLGLQHALSAMGIAHVACGVGDRNVMERMRESGSLLGGEASGHILFLDGHTTGDGLFCALRLLEVLRHDGRSLSRLAGIMNSFPQVLVNVAVRSKPDLEGLRGVQRAMAEATAALSGQGRVLVRYSGTQSQCRVMVEGREEKLIQHWAQRIARELELAIGA
jgi:phosphoglucosamine mutase